MRHKNKTKDTKILSNKKKEKNGEATTEEKRCNLLQQHSHKGKPDKEKKENKDQGLLT